MKFIGRNRGYKDPEALDVDHPLSNTTGAVIDPIMSIRKRLSIESGKTVRISYITGIEDGRDKVLERVKKYSDISNVKRAFELAWTRSQVEGRYLNLTEKKIEVYQRVLSHIVYLSPLRRKIKDLIVNNKKGQSGLWSFGISGDCISIN
jgi:cellobiose phosphorylase